jgi:hypothetical protein
MSIPLNRLQARLERDLYVPLFFRAALHAAQVSWQSAVSDAEAVTSALRRMQRLIQADGVVSWFDSWFEAEVVGARVERDAHGRVMGTPLAPQRLPHSARFLEAPPVRHVLDVARRLCDATREQSTVIAAVSGVRTLAAHMVGPRAPDSAYATAQEAASDIIGALARSYGESGVGAIAVIEETAMADPIDARSFAPVAEVARKLDVPMILLSRHPMPPSVESAIRAVGVSHVAAPGGRGSVCAIPATMLRAAPSASEGWFKLQRQAKPAPRLFLSEGEVPLDAPAETLIALRERVVT